MNILLISNIILIFFMKKAVFSIKIYSFATNCYLSNINNSKKD